jgi:uncharacterized membrane protein YgdD (TMEM256/DUF423 family)
MSPSAGPYVPPSRGFLIAGAVNGGLAVLLGAFAAHVLKQRLNPDMLELFRTGVQYHVMHALALLAVGLVGRRQAPDRVLGLAGWSMLAGILLFSGSLYLLAWTGARWLGAITPVGGIAFVVGWLALVTAVARA